MMQRTSHSLLSESEILLGSVAKGNDLIEGIIKESQKHNLLSGYITCIGSLANSGYVLFQTRNGAPSGYGEAIIKEEPVELITATGFLCVDESGELDIHLHGLMVNEKGEMYGGHMLRGKNPCLVTLEFSVTSSENIVANRCYHESLGFKVIDFKENESKRGAKYGNLR